MYIREAVSEDNDALKRLQAQCPIGTSLVVTAVNSPNFFARARAYESHQVYVAGVDDRIIGSAACATRKALVNGDIRPIGYEFQYFTAPARRREGVARQLHQRIEEHLLQEGAVLSYALIVEDNLPSIKLFSGLGFTAHRTLVMPHLLVYREMNVPSRGRIRPATAQDLRAVATLLNETWQGFNLYEPSSVEKLTGFVQRVPGYTFDNLLILENKGKIVACLGYVDLSPLTLITVQSLSLRLRLTARLLDILRRIRPMPKAVKRGETLRQWVLTPIAFDDCADLATLLKYVNNLAFGCGIDQLFCICEKDHTLLSSMKDFFRVDVSEHLYVKPLREGVSLGDDPIFVSALDL